MASDEFVILKGQAYKEIHEKIGNMRCLLRMLEVVAENVLKESFTGEALLIGEYSILETGMNNLCAAYTKGLGLKVTFVDMHGSGIERAADYLKKVLGIEKVKDPQCWRQLTLWARVRNCLTHNNGFPKTIEDGKEIFEFLGVDTKTQSCGNKITVTYEMCTSFLNLSEKYLEYLYHLGKNNFYE